MSLSVWHLVMTLSEGCWISWLTGGCLPPNMGWRFPVCLAVDDHWVSGDGDHIFGLGSPCWSHCDTGEHITCHRAPAVHVCDIVWPRGWCALCFLCMCACSFSSYISISISPSPSLSIFSFLFFFLYVRLPSVDEAASYGVRSYAREKLFRYSELDPEIFGFQVGHRKHYAHFAFSSFILGTKTESLAILTNICKWFKITKHGPATPAFQAFTSRVVQYNSRIHGIDPYKRSDSLQTRSNSAQRRHKNICALPCHRLRTLQEEITSKTSTHNRALSFW